MKNLIPPLEWLLSEKIQDGFFNEPNKDTDELIGFLEYLREVRSGADICPEYLADVKSALKTILRGLDIPSEEEVRASDYMTVLTEFVADEAKQEPPADKSKDKHGVSLSGKMEIF